MHPVPPTVLAFFLSVSVSILISSDVIDFFFCSYIERCLSSLNTFNLHSCFKPGKASQSLLLLYVP
jgi:hypothetical protein